MIAKQGMVWSIKKLHLPLKYDWVIARGSSSFKENYIVTVQAGDKEGMGEVAWNIRYGESCQKIEEEFRRFCEEATGFIATLEELTQLLSRLTLSNSLRFGIESAFIHFLGAFSDRTVHQLLGLNRVNSAKTSFSIPIMPKEEIASFIEKYNLQRFESIKLKIKNEEDVDLLYEVCKNHQGQIRLDANEGFSDAESVLRYFDNLKTLVDRIEFLEQPLKVSDLSGMRFLKERSPVDLIADEALESEDITAGLVEYFDGVNVKLMKSGGYLRAVRQLKLARSFDLRTMVGCMVETSLGISSALNIAHNVDYLDLDGHLFLKEDPFNLLTEERGRLFYSHLQ